MSTKYDKETVLDAIRGTGPFANRGKPQSSGGVVVTIARRLGVTRQTVYSYMSKWVSVQKAVDDEREAMLDMAEGALYRLVSDGNPTGIIFLLKTRGKDRGYVERQEITGKDGGGLKVEIEYVNSPYSDT